ncbi:sulfatase-like hydrolase/transferase [Actinocorallia populi]|uniref:sulfatase-like hydrolase/transferase n=1 Tax=Actinocorallia populi TaxID=2079200 RepID=UPI001300B87B|nr:sulfatase-like hydrolase/transferase [Actinocorallia populi]
MGEGFSSRRRFLLGLGALTAAASLPGAAPVNADNAAGPGEGPGRRTARARRAPGRPNFVVIVADDFGYGQIGVQGQKKIKTPRIDRMAREGLRFTDAYAAAPVCAPARASLLTGLHVGHSPVRRNPPKDGDLPLPPGIPTIATVLQEAGYRTGVFGKWGFGGRMPNPSHPYQHGFTDFYGYLTHYAAKTYYPEQLWDGVEPARLPGNKGDRGPHYGPDLIMDRALEFVRDSGDDPFLLLLTLPLPHARTTPPPSLGSYAKKDWRRADKIHAAQVTRLDTYVGRLLDSLRRRGLDDDTIVIFTADNGPHEEGNVRPDFFNANGPYRGYKRNLYEGGIRVPFVVWSPKIMSRTRGKRTAHPTVHYDLLATLADFAGVDTPPGTDGLSLRATLTGRGTQPRHEYLYWARLHAGATPSHRAEDDGRGRNAAAAVRFGHWKAVGFAPGPAYTEPGPDWDIELYDLSKDPGEKRNLAKKRPDIAREAQRHLKDAWQPPLAWRLIS